MTHDNLTLDTYRAGRFAYSLHHLTRKDAIREAQEAQAEGYATRILNADGSPAATKGQPHGKAA